MDHSRISISVNSLEAAEIRAAATLQLLRPTTFVHRVALAEARHRLGRGPGVNQSADPVDECHEGAGEPGIEVGGRDYPSK